MSADMQCAGIPKNKDNRKPDMANELRDTLKLVAQCKTVGYELHVKEAERLRIMFELLKAGTPQMKRLSKTQKLRIAWVGYIARVLLSNSNGMYQEGRSFDDPELLASMGFKRDKELRQTFVIGLSGNLEQDLIVNFVARNYAKLEYLSFFKVMLDNYVYAVEKMRHHIECGFGSPMFLPRIETTEEGLEKFFDELLHVEQVEAEEILGDHRKALFTSLENRQKSWMEALTLPASIVSADGRKTSAVLPGYGITHNRRDLNTVDFKNPEVYTSFSKMIGEKSLLLTSAHTAMDLTEKDKSAIQDGFKYSLAIWAERNALTVETQQSEARIKTESYVKKLEKKLDKLSKAQAAPAPKNKQGEKAVSLSPDETVITKEELERLRRQAGRSGAEEARTQKNEARLRETEEKLAEAQSEVERLRRTLMERDAELDSLVSTLDAEDEEKEVDDTALDTSVFDKLNVVCVGGTPAFIQAIQSLHSNIRCYGNKKPSDDAILHADMVWMQTNFIGHKFSIPITAMCRQYDIPLRFFKGKGLVQSRIQMVKETLEFSERNI